MEDRENAMNAQIWGK